MAAIFFIMTASSLTLGCGVDRSKWVGHWEGTKELENEDKVPEKLRGTLKKVELDIWQDGVFTLIDSGMPFAGSVEFEAGQVKLQIKDMLGRPLDMRDPDNKRFSEPALVKKLSEGKFTFEMPGQTGSAITLTLTGEPQKKR